MIIIPLRRTEAEMSRCETTKLMPAMKRFEPGAYIISDSGDSDQTSKLLIHGGKGDAFVAEIRATVTAGRLHAAMHLLKDMPGVGE